MFYRDQVHLPPLAKVHLPQLHTVECVCVCVWTATTTTVSTTTATPAPRSPLRGQATSVCGSTPLASGQALSVRGQAVQSSSRSKCVWEYRYLLAGRSVLKNPRSGEVSRTGLGALWSVCGGWSVAASGLGLLTAGRRAGLRTLWSVGPDSEPCGQSVEAGGGL